MDEEKGFGAEIVMTFLRYLMTEIWLTFNSKQ